MISLGVLVSGSGTNLQSILDAVAERRLDAKVQVVVSNVAGVRALERAQAAGVPTVVVDHKLHADRASFDAALVNVLREHGVEWLALAGFMRLVTPTLLDAFPMRIVNIHPALLPAFPGIHAQGQALRYGVRVTGCTVHFVDAGTDTGPILAQAVVPVREDDDEESLRKRILEKEHALYPLALQWIAEGRVTIEPAKPGERARVHVRGADPVLGVSA
jgi:phosphoribosylglycinamide formyltransferase-1